MDDILPEDVMEKFVGQLKKYFKEEWITHGYNFKEKIEEWMSILYQCCQKKDLVCKCS